MALFVSNESRFFLDEIANDITISLQENGLAVKEEFAEETILKMINAGIKANGDMSKLVKINGLIQHVDDLNWLEKLQVKMENKIREYNRKLKDKNTGTFSKVWTNIKKFLSKIVNFITSAINKLVSYSKLGYKAAKNVAHGTDGDYDYIIGRAKKLDPAIRYKIASRSGAFARKLTGEKHGREAGIHVKNVLLGRNTDDED